MMTTSQVSKSNSSQISQAFFLLHENVQRWIWEQTWDELRDAQEQAIPPIISGESDVCIAASTASGKTEAVFLPICSTLTDVKYSSIATVYIGPLKALINDQYERLTQFCENLNIRVTRWHGDVASAKKKALVKNPGGILLITPESLEAMFVLNGPNIARLFQDLRYIVIDELHSFMGTERGRQLQSLIHRLEIVIQRRVPRIGLSATLGDMEKALDFLRPGKVFPTKLIESKQGNQELKLQVRGYEFVPVEKNDAQDDEKHNCLPLITEHLFKTLRGSKNLVFANSRTMTEAYADSLRRLCEELLVPEEFFPHHGSLSKEIREETESRLKDKSVPAATAICTSTLEMGIDIGSVKAIAQIGTPPSVASLRQRLGRSGRRKGESAILRVYIEEKKICDRTPIQDRLRAELFQTIAMINLLLKGWYEPPEIGNYHFSTLIQQTLSLIAQYGAIDAPHAWKLLCQHGPFEKVDQGLFASLLRCLGRVGLIKQTGESGAIVLDWNGEKLVNSYEFYSAFKTPEEYQLYANGSCLGTMPINFPVTIDMYIIFAGRRWQVTDFDSEKNIIYLKAAKGGRLPNFFGASALVADEVRKEMYRLYVSGEKPKFLDNSAANLFDEGIEYFQAYLLDTNRIIEQGKDVFIFPWYGDRTIYTLCLCLQQTGLSVMREGLLIQVNKISLQEIRSLLIRLFESGEIDTSALARSVQNKVCEKYDEILDDELLCLEYTAKMMDAKGYKKVLQEICGETMRLKM